MFEWIDAMSLLEKVFFYVALPATLIMLIQTVTLFLGAAGDTDLDSDTSGLDGVDAEINLDTPGESFDALDDIAGTADPGLQFITMRGIITFMTVFGWSGVCLMEMGLPAPISALVSVLLGTGAMIGVAFLVRALMGLQSSGNIVYREALGQHADVYLTIPPKGEGKGKITLTLSGSLSQYDAVTEDLDSIRTGEVVRVTDIVRDNVMVVERERT